MDRYYFNDGSTMIYIRSLEGLNLFFVAVAAIFFSVGARCFAQGTVAGAPASHGYRIAVSGQRWTISSQPDSSLTFNFTVVRLDGSPVHFVSTDGAIRVFGWTEDNFDATIGHSATAYFDPNFQEWSVSLPGLDPRSKSAHLEFDIRDPKTTALQTTSLASDFRFENVQTPTQVDVAVPVNETVTTAWNTSITLRSIETSSKNQQGQAQPLETYDFVVDHARTPDDMVQIALNKGFDNGVQLDGLWQYYSQPQTAGEITVNSQQISSDPHKPVSLDFSVNENAYSPVKSIVWTPVQTDIALKGITQPVSGVSVVDTSTTTINGIQYRVEHLKGNGPYSDSFFIWSQFPDTTKIYRLKSADWSPVVGAQTWQNPNSNLTKSVYWHADGTVADLHEHGAFDQVNGGPANFPLQLVFDESSHTQQVLSFHGIPVPMSGQSLLLRRSADGAEDNGLRLKSIELNKPDNPGNGNQDPSKAYTLSLAFQCVDMDGSTLSLAVIAARDSANNSIDQNLLSGITSTGDPTSVDPNQRLFNVTIPLPPQGSKLINLRLILTKDSPVGPGAKIIVDSSGKWSAMSVSAASSIDTALQAQQQPQAQQQIAVQQSKAPAIIALPNHGFQVSVTNVHWDNGDLPQTNLAFDFTITHADGSPVNFVNANGAVYVHGSSDTNFDTFTPHSTLAYRDQGGQTWHASLPGVDPRNASAHIEIDIRDPDTTTAQSTYLSSDIRFKDIPLPNHSAAPETLNQTFVSDWGTTFTLKQLTLNATGQYGQQATEFDFSVDRTNVTDDQVDVQFQKAYDGGVPINDLYSSYNNNPSISDEVIAATGPVIPGAHTKADLEFQFEERAFSPARNIIWTPVTLDVPLSTISVPVPKYMPSSSSRSSFGTIDFSLEHVVNPQQYSADNYVLWAKSQDKSLICRLLNVQWALQQNPYQQYQQQNNTSAELYWHMDGTPISIGETGIGITRDSANAGQVFPLTVMAQLVKHNQQVITYSNLPIPASGKAIVLNRKPDGDDLTPVRLRAIAWSQTGDRSALTLTFEYDTADSALVSLGIVSARDDKGNAIDCLANQQYAPAYVLPVVDSNLQTVVIQTAVPPSVANAINLSLILTKDTPSVAPLEVKVDKSGVWSVTAAN